MGAKNKELVERGLRQYFLTCHRGKGQLIAMPSKAVDAAWHELMMHTAAYQAWCELTLGRFLHHAPAEALRMKADRNDALRRTWFWACRDEGINPRLPTRLSLLFALDAKLGRADGFSYLPDCSDIGRKSDKSGKGGNGGNSYCGDSFSDGSARGSSADFGNADAGFDGDGAGGDGGGGGGD